MKIFLYILPLLLLPFMGFAQEQTAESVKKEQKSYKNQIDLDVELLGVSLGCHRKILKKWGIGFSLGAGYALTTIYDINRNHSEFRKPFNLYGELFHIGLLIKYIRSNKTTYVIEPRITLISEPPINTEAAKNKLFGVGFGFYYGEKIQIGVKFFISYYSNGSFDYRFPEKKIHHTVLSSNLLILRIPIEW